MKLGRSGTHEERAHPKWVPYRELRPMVVERIQTGEALEAALGQRHSRAELYDLLEQAAGWDEAVHNLMSRFRFQEHWRSAFRHDRLEQLEGLSAGQARRWLNQKLGRLRQLIDEPAE